IMTELGFAIFETAIGRCGIVWCSRGIVGGEIAERLGDRTLARDVGEALSQNPWPIIVPCHRVLASGGKLGGFSAHGGIDTKLRLLSIEGARPGGAMLFDDLPITPRRPTSQRRRRA